MGDDEQAARMRSYISQLFAEGKANEELRRTDPDAYQRKMEAEMPESYCCLCRVKFRGFGHNPWPIVEHGVACDTCNDRVVMAQRRRALRRH